MKKKLSPRTSPPDKSEADKATDETQSQTSRDDELRNDEDVLEAVTAMYEEVRQGFRNQNDRSNDIMDYWDLYNCKLGNKQFYSGTSKIFVPIINGAVNARKTRFTNQIFPQSGRNVDITSSDGTIPFAEIALLEHYIRRADLRSRVVPALIRNGDIEGQYTVYCSWAKSTKSVAKRVRKPIEEEDGALEDETVEDVIEEEYTSAGPQVEVIGDPDLVVLPSTVDSLEEAIESGGSVTILRRWTKAKIEQMIKDKELDKEQGKKLAEDMKTSRDPDMKDKSKEMSDDAGIKTHNGVKYAIVYETWTKLTIKGADGKKERRLCRIYYGGENAVLSVKRNPYWSDLLPIVSAPVEKIQGVFKGASKVGFVADMQYLANDATNEAMDSAAYAMMPIVMTDPEKNPRTGSMILSMAAIWEVDPNSTKFAQFPELWKQGFEIVSSAKSEIFQSLGVNPAQITQGGGSKKRNQAEIAAEQQVDILSTADVVTVLENAILTPILNRMIAMDHQFRDKKLMVMQFGEMGSKAVMQEIDPVTFDQHYAFRWFGVEAARSAQQIQQQIAGLNILRGIPPQQYEGYKLDLVPVITQFVENTFGPRLAPLVFKNLKDEQTADPQLENSVLMEGIDLDAHKFDDLRAHMAAHIKALQATGDPTGSIRKHILSHQQIVAEMKAEAMKQQMQAQMQQQGPPGAPGMAKPGAQPGVPRPQGPPGMIHNDAMQDPRMMPRRAG